MTYFIVRMLTLEQHLADWLIHTSKRCVKCVAGGPSTIIEG